MRNSKENRGSIALFVLIAMMFFLFLVLNAYMHMTNSMQVQNDEMTQIKKNYEQDLTEERLNEIYEEKTN